MHRKNIFPKNRYPKNFINRYIISYLNKALTSNPFTCTLRQRDPFYTLCLFVKMLFVLQNQAYTAVSYENVKFF